MLRRMGLRWHQQSATACLLLLLLQVSLKVCTASDSNSAEDTISFSSSTVTRSISNSEQRKLRSTRSLRNSLWIVELNDPPAVAYKGGVPGLAATAVQPVVTAAAAAAGSSSAATAAQPRARFNAASAAAVQYAGYISAQAESAVSRSLGASYTAKIRHRYNTVISGFTIGPLTTTEVHALRQDSNVKSVTRDSRGWVKTISTPAFLGLSSPGGAWAQLPGGAAKAGDGIVIGMIDTGYWPEGPSFSDREVPDAAGVNSSSGGDVFGPPPPHFKGSCTAGEDFPSTTCNHKVIGCRYFHAAVGKTAADVKAVYPYEQISCRSVDAVSHGSHTASTAAGRHDIPTHRGSYPGVMSGMAPGARLAIYKASWGSDDGGFSSDFVSAIEGAVRDGVDVINYSLGAAADLTHVTPVETAFRHAAAAGVLVAAACGNTGPEPSTIVDTWGPWIMSVGASTHSRAYVDNPAAAAEQEGDITAQQVSAPVMASFSSRGPIVAGDGNLLKPDITAPGVEVVAQVGPAFTDGWGSKYTAAALQGTSMSSPHVAGIAALVMAQHPTWSPMAVKSALMTTAYQICKTGPLAGKAFGGPFDFGAGHVNPTAALNPGLILDSNEQDWMRFLCGSAQVPAHAWPVSCPDCTSNRTLCDPSNLNMPSIAVSAVAGRKTVYRTLTNVQGTATFTANVSAPKGFTVTVIPKQFTSNLGDNKVVKIHIVQIPNTAVGVWQSGAVTWTSDIGTSTRLPVVLKAAHIAVKPAEIRLKSYVPKYTFFVEPSWTGFMYTKTAALQASQVIESRVEYYYDIAEITVTLPAGVWSHVRFSLFNDDVSDWGGALPAGNDLNMKLYKGSRFIASSANDYNSDEEINISNASGTYRVQVTMGHPGSATDFKLHVWHLNLTDSVISKRNMLVTSQPDAEHAVAVSGGLSYRRVVLNFVDSLQNVSSSSSRPRYLGAVLYYKSVGGQRNRGSFKQVPAYTIVSLM